MDKLGKYEIVGKIGVGGFGVVYKGYDPFIKRHVAIKTCAAEDTETRERFLREAEIAGNLQHRNIVTVFEFGYQEETPYLVQEFLTGEDLDHKIRRGDAVPITEKVAWLVEIARGLEFAHGRGVIHRDIKPANIRILQDGNAKILDFGIAKLAQQQSTLTQAGVTLGTASYLAPEQIRGEVIDFRTDLFSFGVLGYELLTYERPFRAQEISSLFYKLLNEEPAPISSRTPGVPVELERIVMRCLEKDPKHRWSTTGELLRGLERLEATGPRQAWVQEPEEKTRAITREEPTRRVEAPLPTAQDRTMTLDELELEHARHDSRPESVGMSPANLRRGGWIRWAAGIGAAALLTLVVVAVTRTRSDEPAPTPPTAAVGSHAMQAPATRTAAPPAAAVPAPVEAPATPPESIPEPTPEPKPEPPKPKPEPPKPAHLQVAAAWDPTMTLTVGGRTYRLDQPHSIEVPAGSARLEFSVDAPGYRVRRELPMQVKPGQTIEVSIPIEKPGRLSVQQHIGTRPGTVRLDGQVLGRAPVRGVWLTPGDHFLEVFPLGGDPSQPTIARNVSVRSDVDSVLTFDLDGKLETVVREKPLGGTPPAP